MFKISHEVPISMLEESRDFNDYDYALVHVFEKSKEYFNFYKESLQSGREVILDNSAYELGYPYNPKKYAEYIEELKPTEYILPDYRDDGVKNLAAIKDFVIKNRGLEGVKIGVVHGATYEEFCENYKAIQNWVDKIAISVETFFFENEGDPTEARIEILKRMAKEGVIDTDRKHHILGALSPTEYHSFVEYKWIESVDTSNPVLHGLIGQQYHGVIGLERKSKMKIDQMMHLDVSESQRQVVYFNINWFKTQLRKSNSVSRVACIKPQTSDAEKEASAEYYRHFPIETYDLMVKIWGEEMIALWCEITAFKYRMRLGIKDPSKIEVDLTKEKNYLNKAKELRSQVVMPG